MRFTSPTVTNALRAVAQARMTNQVSMNQQPKRKTY